WPTGDTTGTSAGRAGADETWTALRLAKAETTRLSESVSGLTDTLATALAGCWSRKSVCASLEKCRISPGAEGEVAWAVGGCWLAPLPPPVGALPPPPVGP